MFPSIEIFWFKFYFHWIGIILATFVFLYLLYRYTKKFNLRFSDIFWYFSFFIIVPYILWRYFYDLIEYKSFLPLSLFDLISPYQYRFSFIWISLWIFIIICIFLLKSKYKEERKKYIDVFFYSICLSLVVLGPFMLLWDVFYGNIAQDSILWIKPFVEETQIPFTKPIWPVWIFVSLLWIWLYFISKVLSFIFKKSWISLFLISFLFLWFAFIFNFQDYSKRFLFDINSFSLDLKIFYCYFMAIISPIYLFLITRKNKKW